MDEATDSQKFILVLQIRFVFIYYRLREREIVEGAISATQYERNDIFSPSVWPVTNLVRIPRASSIAVANIFTRSVFFNVSSTLRARLELGARIVGKQFCPTILKKALLSSR